MVNRAKCVFEINICDVYVLVGESCVFERCYDHLNLPRGVTLGAEAFLAKMEYSMLFAIACK